MSQKILVVDDETGIVQLLKDYFEMQGYEIITANNGVEAIQKVSEKPDLILLDINMPRMDGLEVCREIRSLIMCPILFLTAKVEEQDKINGFLMGGDDYILKPFSIEELGVRVMAHLRRELRRTSTNEVKLVHDISIHYQGRMVYYQEKPIHLTKTEFDILELLSLNPGQIFGKEFIYEKVRGLEADGDSSIVMEHIRRIRNKIAAFTTHNYIETIWGVGYKWIG